MMGAYRNEALNRDVLTQAQYASATSDNVLVLPESHKDAVSRMRTVRLWDLPLRLFHWSLVIAVLVAIVSAKVGGEWMTLHGQAGLVIVGLLVFRLIWGVVGGKHARFLHFVPSVSSVRAYLRGQWQGRGHNPLGAFAVFLMLGLLLLQAIGGLFTDDEISFTGPLAYLIESETAVRLTGWHHQLSDVVIAILVLHVLAIVIYRLLKKKNLVKPMITGVEQIPVAQASQISEEVPVRPWVLVQSLVFAISLTYWVSTGFALPNSGSASVVAPPTETAAPTPTW